MTEPIPKAVVIADEAHFRINERILWSRYLNPYNVLEARIEFMRGAEAPPFRYHALPDPDGILRELDAFEPPRDHPAGALVGRLFDGTRLLVRALRDRTAEAFHEMAESAGWYPDPELLALHFEETELEDQPMDVPASRIIARLREALTSRGLDDWVVLEDSVMAARVLVRGARRELRVDPHARFRERDLDRLVVHEIDIHATRTENGRRQALRCFETGLPESLVTEEGLAMVAEERAGVASPSVLPRQTEVVWAIDRARHLGFRDLFDRLVERVGAPLAWGIGIRIKRGLGEPGLPGVYAKDSAYLRGRMEVLRWLDEGGDPADLFVGKVSIDDPVADWVEQGWLTRQRVPESWAGTVT